MAFWNVDVSRFALSALSFHPFIALEGCLEEGCCFVILARKDGKILRGDNFTREGIKLIFFFSRNQSYCSVVILDISVSVPCY